MESSREIWNYERLNNLLSHGCIKLLLYYISRDHHRIFSGNIWLGRKTSTQISGNKELWMVKWPRKPWLYELFFHNFIFAEMIRGLSGHLSTFVSRFIYSKNGKRKIQGTPQSQAAVLPRHQNV